jgi:integrase
MPELLTRFLVRTAKADGGKALEIRDSRVSGLILRVEPTGSKRYLADYYVREFDLETGKPRRKHRRIKLGASWKPDKKGKENPVTTLEQARAKAKALLAEAAGGSDPKERESEELRQKALAAASSKTLGQFIEDKYRRWRLHNTLTGKKAKESSARKDLNRLERSWPELMDTPLADITQTTVRDKRTVWAEGGRAPEAINRDVSVLRSALSAATKLTPGGGTPYLASNPLAGMEQLKGDTTRKPRAFTVEEEAAVKKALHRRHRDVQRGRASHNRWRRERRLVPLPPRRDALQLAVLVSLATGVRRSELFALRWSKNIKHSRIDLADAKVYLVGTDTKNGNSREIELGPEILKTLKKEHEAGQSLRKGGNVVPLDGGYLIKGRKGAMTDMKNPWSGVIKSAGLRGRGLTWHSLRHTFCTRLLHAGADIYTVKEMAGHSSIETTARYLATNEARRRAAVSQL